MHSSHASWHTDVFCFPSSKQLYVVKRIYDLVSFRPLLCPQSWKWLLCQVPYFGITWRVSRDSWHSLHYRISLKILMIQFLKFPPIPSPCLWFLDWGHQLFLAFHHSLHHHATSSVYKLSSLFCSAFNPHHYVPAFSNHLNPTCNFPLTLFSS